MTPFISFVEHQRGMMNRFNEIETQNGFWRALPAAFNLQDPHDQTLLRRYAWQVTEEVCEVLDAWNDDSRAEEIADVYHFLIELAIVGGLVNDLCELLPQTLEEHFELIPKSERNDSRFSPRDYWLMFIEHVAMTMNQLKNRPWRKDHRPTNPSEFVKDLYECFIGFYHAAAASGQTALSLSLAYSLKAAINEKRYQDQIRPDVQGNSRTADSSGS